MTYLDQSHHTRINLIRPRVPIKRVQDCLPHPFHHVRVTRTRVLLRLLELLDILFILLQHPLDTLNHTAPAGSEGHAVVPLVHLRQAFSLEMLLEELLVARLVRDRQCDIL